MEYCYYMKCGKIKGQLAINKIKNPQFETIWKK